LLHRMSLDLVWARSLQVTHDIIDGRPQIPGDAKGSPSFRAAAFAVSSI
jgi:hypothetical protein